MDESNRSENIGLSLAAYINKKKAIVSSSNLKNGNLEKLIDRCIDAAKITPDDEFNSLPDKELLFKSSKELDLLDNFNSSSIEILGCDSIFEFKGEAFGKPLDKEEAFRRKSRCKQKRGSKSWIR